MRLLAITRPEHTCNSITAPHSDRDRTQPQHMATHDGRHRSVSAARPQRPAHSPLFPQGTVPLAAPQPDKLQTAVHSTTLCSPDLYNYTHFRNGDFCVAAPMALGHEAAGVVVAVGSAAADGWSVGDRVALEVGIPCLRDPTYGSGGSRENGGSRAEGAGAEGGGRGSRGRGKRGRRKRGRRLLCPLRRGPLQPVRTLHLHGRAKTALHLWGAL